MFQLFFFSERHLLLASFYLAFFEFLFILVMLFDLLLPQAFEEMFDRLCLLVGNLPIALLPKLIIIFGISSVLSMLQRLPILPNQC
jgi:hypothetical protein